MRQSALIRVYADTSVFGGVYDEEFDIASIEFFAQIRENKRRLVISDIVRREIEATPEYVRALFEEMLRKIPRFNAINALEGYQSILIHSPREVIEYEDENL